MRASRVTTKPFILTLGILLVPVVLPARGQTCVLPELQKLIALDKDEFDQFGSSVSISKNRLIVGAWRGDSAGIVSGAAYVFRRDDNETPNNPSDDFWVEEDKLVALDATSGDLFGWSVSISGDHAVVGARFHTFPDRSGSAYVFRHDDNETPSDASDDFWVQEDRLKASDAAPGDEFGNSVSIDGDRIIVGAFEDDDACFDNPDPNCDSGSAYVFRRSDNGTPTDPTDDFWVQKDKLTALDAVPGDNFGFSVSISGDRAVVGAWHDDIAGTDSGSAYVFRHDDNGTATDPSDDFWVFEDQLIALDAAARDNFGVSVSISGDRAVAGAWLDDDVGNLSGSAYVFRRDDNGTFLDPSDDFWVQEDKLIASDGAAGDEFGKSVSIAGDRLAVGAYETDDACPEGTDPNCDSGSAYVFGRNDNDTPWDPSDDFWVQKAKLVASDTAAGDFFGRVAISGDQVVTGSLDDAVGENSGSAYVFTVAQECLDLADFARFQTCASDDGGGVLLGCETFNVDGDDDVDVEDYGYFLRTFTGP